MKQITAIVLGVLIAMLLIVTPSSAYYGRVLGISTDHLTIPPTVEGPGFLLPDSPFYFLDNFKQQLKLLFAFSHERRAQVYMDIAGERLAELRIMLLKNNADASEVALNGVRENTMKAAEELQQAKLAGHNTQDLAQTLNLTIKERLNSLDFLDQQAKGEMKAAVDYATATLTDAKSIVEDSLPEADLENEIRDDATREVRIQLMQTMSSTQEVQAALDELQKQATGAAQQSLSNRKDALQKVIQQEQQMLNTLQNPPKKK